MPQRGKPPCPPPGTGTPPIPTPQGAKPHSGHPLGRFCKCRLGSVAGDARGKTPLPTTPLSKTPPVFHTVWKRLWTFPRLFHSLWKTMLKSTVCIAVCNPRRPRIRALQQKNTPPAVLWICIKNRTDKFRKSTASPTGCPQMPVDRTPGFPTENRKIRPQRLVCRGRNAAGHQKILPKPPPDADFHNPSRQNPDIPHRTAPAKTPKSSCRGWIFRFSTVPRPLLLLLLDRRIEGWTDRARARGRRKAGRH